LQQGPDDGLCALLTDFSGLFFSEIQEVVVGDWRCHAQTTAMPIIKDPYLLLPSVICPFCLVYLRVQSVAKGSPILFLIGQRFSFSLGGEPDDDHTQGVYQGDCGAGLGVAAAKHLHQLAHLQGAGGRQNAPEIEA